MSSSSVHVNNGSLPAAPPTRTVTRVLAAASKSFLNGLIAGAPKEAFDAVDDLLETCGVGGVVAAAGMVAIGFGLGYAAAGRRR